VQFELSLVSFLVLFLVGARFLSDPLVLWSFLFFSLVNSGVALKQLCCSAALTL
jgi:hypothetical protein